MTVFIIMSLFVLIVEEKSRYNVHNIGKKNPATIQHTKKINSR